MPFAAGCLVSALVLASGAAVGIVDSWALPVAAVVLLLASVVAAVAMEERSLSVDGLVASAAVQAPSAPASAGAELPLTEVA